MRILVPVKKTTYGFVVITDASMQNILGEIRSGNFDKYANLPIRNTETYFEVCDADCLEELIGWQSMLQVADQGGIA